MRTWIFNLCLAWWLLAPFLFFSAPDYFRGSLFPPEELGGPGTAPLSVAKMAPFNIQYADLTVRKSNGAPILNQLNGTFRAGRLCAIMGGSGSGKSTLLNALMGAPSLRVEGRVTSLPRRAVGFVPQADTMHTELDPFSTLWASASSRLPPGDDPIVEAKTALRILHMEKYAFDRIGSVSDVNDRLSGGQKKRVNIGMELVAKPSALFLDEPTSGLDSVTSFDLALALKSLTVSYNMPIAAVVHSPTPRTFEVFDDLVLLQSGGWLIYEGPRANATGYFKSKGYRQTPTMDDADFFMTIVQEEQKILGQKASELWKQECAQGGEYCKHQAQAPAPQLAPSPPPPSTFRLVTSIFWRTHRLLRLQLMPLGIIFFMGCIIGWMFASKDPGVDGFSTLAPTAPAFALGSVFVTYATAPDIYNVEKDCGMLDRELQGGLSPLVLFAAKLSASVGYAAATQCIFAISFILSYRLENFYMEWHTRKARKHKLITASFGGVGPQWGLILPTRAWWSAFSVLLYAQFLGALIMQSAQSAARLRLPDPSQASLVVVMFVVSSLSLNTKEAGFLREFSLISHLCKLFLALELKDRVSTTPLEPPSAVAAAPSKDADLCSKCKPAFLVAAQAQAVPSLSLGQRLEALSLTPLCESCSALVQEVLVAQNLRRLWVQSTQATMDKGEAMQQLIVQQYVREVSARLEPQSSAPTTAEQKMFEGKLKDLAAFQEACFAFGEGLFAQPELQPVLPAAAAAPTSPPPGGTAAAAVGEHSARPFPRIHPEAYVHALEKLALLFITLPYFALQFKSSFAGELLLLLPILFWAGRGKGLHGLRKQEVAWGSQLSREGDAQAATTPAKDQRGLFGRLLILGFYAVPFTLVRRVCVGGVISCTLFFRPTTPLLTPPPYHLALYTPPPRTPSCLFLTSHTPRN